jgi:quercetin dioxygenase-like cupin family protein
MVKATTARGGAVAAALAIAFGAACSSGSDSPGDPVATAPGHYSVMLENDVVRVLRIRYAPGDRTEMHHHPDGIVVALNGSQTRFTLPDGTTQDISLPTDAGNYMPAGDHGAENVGAVELEAILVEFKGAQAGTATLPTAREGQSMTMLAEGAFGSAYRVAAEPTSEEAAGTTHEFDQVVIALAPTEVSLTVDGQAPKTSWARGDVAFIPRNTGHASKNLSGMAADYVLVMIK